jgi:thiamine biosynthesis lipoprotein ApbE
LRYILSTALFAAVLSCGEAEIGTEPPRLAGEGQTPPPASGGGFSLDSPSPILEVPAQGFTCEVMGGLFHIELVLKTRSQVDAKALVEDAFAEAQRIEELLNMWASSTLSNWNLWSATMDPRAVQLDFELAVLASIALQFAGESNGAFDPTIAPVLRDLGFYGGEALVVDDALLASWRAKVGYQKVGVRPLFDGVLFDTVRQLGAAAALRKMGKTKVERQAKGIQLDLSSMAKGYAAERMAVVLRDGGITNAKISAGSSSVLAFGPGPGGAGSEPGWAVELPHPDGPVTWWLLDEALSTSGQSSITLQGIHKGKSHILDPRTLEPVSHRTEMVVVRGASAVHCDMLSTALLVMGADAGSVWFTQAEVSGVAMLYSAPLVGESAEIVMLDRR